MFDLIVQYTTVRFLTCFTSQPSLQIWMDAELGKALGEDDREFFLSVIDHNLELFNSQQQQLLYFVCASGAIKCAEALLKGDTRLAVDLNHPCTEIGMYPLHCAALYLFPSMVELFLCSGAQTDIKFRPSNLSDIYPHSILEAHINKLPLHMALWRISCGIFLIFLKLKFVDILMLFTNLSFHLFRRRLPCIKEWSPEHTVAKLITLFCLPRMACFDAFYVLLLYIL